MIKKAILLFFLSVTISSLAQKKPAYLEKRAKSASEFIATEMNFNATQKNDIYSILIEKYDSNRKRIRGKNLSKKEKQLVYKASFAETTKNLLKKFTKKEVNSINKLHREWQKKQQK